MSQVVILTTKHYLTELTSPIQHPPNADLVISDCLDNKWQHLVENIDEQSQAALDAKAQGLEDMSFGRYGKDGVVTHKSVNGKLQPVKGAKKKAAPKKKAPAKKAAPKKKAPAKKAAPKKNADNQTPDDHSKKMEHYKRAKKTLQALDKALPKIKKKLARYETSYMPGVYHLPLEALAKATGISVEDLNDLYNYYRHNYKDYLLKSPMYPLDYPNFAFKAYLLNPLALRKPQIDIVTPQLEKIGAIDDTTPTQSGGQFGVEDFLKRNGIDGESSTDLYRIDQEAKEHGRIIDEARAEVAHAISDWVEHSIWSYTTKRRNQIFKEIDRVIKEKKPRLKRAREIYRGISPDLKKKSGFFARYFDQLTPGSIIDLPPSGFSADPRVAAKFAVENHTDVAIVLRVRPSNPDKGVRGISIWRSGAGKTHHTEREIITDGGSYRVDEVRYTKTSSRTTIMLITLTQVDTLEENMNTRDTNKKQMMDIINGIMFGDSMRNTAKNLRKMAGASTPQKKVTDEKVDTYSIDTPPTETDNDD